VETAPGAFDESEPLVAVHDTLASDPVALGPSVSCHPTATISATFQLEADSMDAAIDAATAAFGRALDAAGAGTDRRVVEVSPA
jgi:hypothetical protein